MDLTAGPLGVPFNIPQFLGAGPILMAQDSSSLSGGKEPRTTGSVPLPRSKRGAKAYFNDVVRELKRVDWPTVPETHRLTAVVLTVCLALVAILTGLSSLFEILTKLITKGTI